MDDIVLLGPPGSGKGTQARHLVESMADLVHLSTGDVLRREIKQETQLGLEVEKIMSEGKFPNDALIVALVKNWMVEYPEKAVLFDGFPRTATQVDAFVEMQKSLGRSYRVIELKVSSDDLKNRLIRRCVCASCGYIDQKCSLQNDKSHDWVCPSCGAKEVVVRSDDSDGVINDRLALYDSHIESIRERLMTHKVRYCVIDGSQTILAVSRAVDEALQEGK